MAKQLNVRPNIGIRIKLASSGSGKWEDSGGDASKFGLTSSELLEALTFGKEDMKDCLKLIHFISAVRLLKYVVSRPLCVRHAILCAVACDGI